MKTTNESTKDREIVITRLLNAPRELVWKVWTEPEHIATWWGPNGFTNTIHKMEVKPGGTWEYMMHGPDNTDYPNRIAYSEVIKPEKLVYAHDDGSGNEEETFHVTVTFDEQDGKTNLTMRLVFSSAAIRNKVVEEYGAVEGGNQTINKLEKYLERM